jgi:serine/threonine protein kinase
MIGKRLGNLRIIAEIGEGGMGLVYLAEHVGLLGKRFAVKSLSKALQSDPSFRRRFSEEAQRQALLDHPNIVQVTDFFEEDGQFFLVMEYVDGEDLSQRIKSKGKLPEPEAVAIFRDILQGLQFAHAKGLVHRDMKPSNVRIDKSGRVRIMDFGIAILAGADGKRLTATGAPIGSPWYMSPEQIERPQEVDRRSDIYALGVLLYEMLTGEVPFDAESDFNVRSKQINAPIPDPREKNPAISKDMAQIIMKAMAKNPGKRFQDCIELLHAIDARQSPDRRFKWTTVNGVLVAVMVASAGVIVYLFSPLPGGAPPSRPPLLSPPIPPPEEARPPLPGGAPPSRPPLPSPPVRQPDEPRPPLTPAQKKDELLSQLRKEGFDRVNVESIENGVVILTGSVDTNEQRDRVLRLAREVTGANTVEFSAWGK